MEDFKLLIEGQTTVIKEQAAVIKQQLTTVEEIKAELTKVKKATKVNRIITISVAVIFVAAIAVLFIFRGTIFAEFSAPAITLMSPAPVSAENREEIVIDAVLSDLPHGVFPAASLSVDFDRNRLEFVGVRQGTMQTLSGAGNSGFNVPIWRSDAEASNRVGRINTMYLDITGGDFAYVREGFARERQDIILRLVFRLRDSVQAGDILDIVVVDAVIAAIDGSETGASLATDPNLRTLRAYSAKIVVV
jgi:hypothetical protein